MTRLGKFRKGRSSSYIVWVERDIYGDEEVKRAAISIYINLKSFKDGSEVIFEVDINKMLVIYIEGAEDVKLKKIKNNFKDYFLKK